MKTNKKTNGARPATRATAAPSYRFPTPAEAEATLVYAKVAEAVNAGGRKFNVDAHLADAIVDGLRAAEWIVDVPTPNPDAKAPEGSVHIILSKATT